MRITAGFLLPREKLLHDVLDSMNGVRMIQISSTQQNNRATEKKMNLYVYSAENDELVEVIEASTNEQCEKLFIEKFDMNDFYSSYCEK